MVVPDAELDGARMIAEVDILLNASGRLAAMGDKAAGVGRRDADNRVAELLEEHARSPHQSHRGKQQ